MVLVLSALSLGCGGVMACLPLKTPNQIVIVERFSGGLLVAGLLLIGGGLPLFR